MSDHAPAQLELDDYAYIYLARIEKAVKEGVERVRREARERRELRERQMAGFKNWWTHDE